MPSLGCVAAAERSQGTLVGAAAEPPPLQRVITENTGPPLGRRRSTVAARPSPLGRRSGYSLEHSLGPPPLKWAISEVTRWGRRAAAEVGDYREHPLPPPLKWVITELTRWGGHRSAVAAGWVIIRTLGRR